MNIIFMGTPDFAVDSLKALYDSGHNIKAVISQPDRPVGRGMKLMATPVKEYALSKNIPVYQPEKIRKDEELIEKMKGMKPDVIVVVAFGQILPQSILDIPKYGCINVHGSLLPKYRGAAPIQWSIINGEEKTGVTTMYMNAGMDTGDMIEKYELDIEHNDTYGTLYDKLKTLGAKAIVHTLEKIADGTASKQKQSDDFTMAPMIQKEMGKIDWNKKSVEIRNLIRGFNPTPGAYTEINNQKMKIWNAELVTEEKVYDIEKYFPGDIVCADEKNGFIMKTGDGLIELIDIQMQNSKRMNAKEYLRGHKIIF